MTGPSSPGFFGVRVESNKSVTIDNSKGQWILQLHSAVLSGPKLPAQGTDCCVSVAVKKKDESEDGTSVFWTLCHLSRNVNPQATLNQTFSPLDVEVTLKNTGGCTVEITGFAEPNEEADDDMSDDEEEAAAEVNPKSSMSTVQDAFFDTAAAAKAAKADLMGEIKSKSDAITKRAGKRAKEDAELEAAATKKAKQVDANEPAYPKKVVRGVQVEEIALGKGPMAAKGRKVSILYDGRLINGKRFDKNDNRKHPFKFRLGVGEVIKGMDRGVEGMRVGGKRRLTIPSKLGYGSQGAPPDIPRNATLIFDIEVLKV